MEKHNKIFPITLGDSIHKTLMADHSILLYGKWEYRWMIAFRHPKYLKISYAVITKEEIDEALRQGKIEADAILEHTSYPGYYK